MATLNLKKKKFIDEDNLKKIVAIGINFGERLNSIETSLIAEYDSTKTYIIGEACYHDNYIYKCKSTATGEWNPDRWQLIGDDITELTLDEIKAMIGLSQEQIDTLASIILDSEIRLDKTYSSSKIYMSIQQCLSDSKTYTLEEIGKMSGASYKVVNNTTEMTEERYIYLLANGNNFDMYIYEADTGNTVQIGNTTIDLSDYYKKAEIDADFLKIADADNKFATIETVNNHINDTTTHPTDSHIKDVVGLTQDGANLTIRKSDETEGGQINLEVGTNSSLYNGISIDTCYDNLRFFEAGGDHRGASLNVAKLGADVSSRLCTTTVDDVAKTKVTLSDGIGGEVTYCVVNGICYVKGWGVYTNTIPSYTLPICNLPKCGLSQYSRAIYNGEDNKDNANINSFYIDDNSTILYGHFVSNKTSWFSFSYPVAES